MDDPLKTQENNKHQISPVLHNRVKMMKCYFIFEQKVLGGSDI